MHRPKEVNKQLLSLGMLRRVKLNPRFSRVTTSFVCVSPNNLRPEIENFLSFKQPFDASVKHPSTAFFSCTLDCGENAGVRQREVGLSFDYLDYVTNGGRESLEVLHSSCVPGRVG